MTLVSNRLRKLPSWTPALVVPALFFLAGLLTLRNFGPTVDEGESIRGALIYAKMVKAFLTGQTIPRWPFHTLPGFYFPIDLFRIAVARATHLIVPSLNLSQGFHLATLFLSSLSLFLLYRIADRVTQSKRVALLSTLALALFPQFVAHSQNNPKDSIALFAFVLGVDLLLMDGRSESSSLSFLAKSLGLGLAFTTSTMTALLLPLVLIWTYVFQPLRRNHLLKQQALLMACGTAIGFLFWPWLWPAPISRIFMAAHRLLHFDFNTREVYLGAVNFVDDLPWHYVPLHLAASTPILFLLAALASLVWLRRGTVRSPMAALVGLGSIWFLLAMMLALNSGLKYNGMRHFLFALPAMALLVGAGLDAIIERANKIPPWILLSLTFASGVVAIATTHPYEGAYLNEVVNTCISDHAENYFSTEYFGQAYLEGARWLNQHAELNAEIIVPFFYWVANPTLRIPARPELRRFDDDTQTRYLMFITRVSRYTPKLNSLQTDALPVFEIRRQKATLLRIYRREGAPQ